MTREELFELLEARSKRSGTAPAGSIRGRGKKGTNKMKASQSKSAKAGSRNRKGATTPPKPAKKETPVAAKPITTVTGEKNPVGRENLARGMQSKRGVSRTPGKNPIGRENLMRNIVAGRSAERKLGRKVAGVMGKLAGPATKVKDTVSNVAGVVKQRVLKSLSKKERPSIGRQNLAKQFAAFNKDNRSANKPTVDDIVKDRVGKAVSGLGRKITDLSKKVGQRLVDFDKSPILNALKKGREGAGTPTPSPNKKPPTKNVKVTPKKPTPDEDFAPKPSDKPSTTKPAPQKPSKPAPKSPNDPAPKSPRSPDQTRKVVKDRVRDKIDYSQGVGRIDILAKPGTDAFRRAVDRVAKKRGAEIKAALIKGKGQARVRIESFRWAAIQEALMSTLPTLS
jgi:hypothetical protein